MLYRELKVTFCILRGRKLCPFIKPHAWRVDFGMDRCLTASVSCSRIPDKHEVCIIVNGGLLQQRGIRFETWGVISSWSEWNSDCELRKEFYDEKLVTKSIFLIKTFQICSLLWKKKDNTKLFIKTKINRRLILKTIQ